MPEPWLVPVYQPLTEPSPLPPVDLASQFPPHEIEGESSSASRPLLDRDTILFLLARSPTIQRRSGRDEIGLINRLGSSWSVENALKNCTSHPPHLSPPSSPPSSHFPLILRNKEDRSNK
jgi:hypothetical protein